MDRAALIGLLLAAIGVLGGRLLEGGSLYALLQPAAFLIVFIGTAGAICLQFSMKQVLLALRLLRWVFLSDNSDRHITAMLLVRWSAAARKEGVLSLEQQLTNDLDPFIARGLRLLIDGTQPEKIREVLNDSISVFEAQHRQAAKVWEAAGGYAPTIGILGAVLGLIHVMEHLDTPSQLGAGIAVAFVATVYGVGLANLLFLPIANKLKGRISYAVQTYDMVTTGLLGIGCGENPRLIEERCSSYLE